MKLRRGTAALAIGIIFLVVAGSQVQYALDANTRILMFVPGCLFVLVGLFLRRQPEAPTETDQQTDLIVSPDEARRARAVQAAKRSWIVPLFGFVLGIFAGNIVVALSILVGIGYGIFALSQVSKCGSYGIRAPALIGLFLSAFLLALYALPFLLIPATR